MSLGPTPDRLVYGFDPLCGWCYGLIPALETLTRLCPGIPIELRLGGLVTGERVRPYVEMADYIRGASKRMAAVTGQGLGNGFFDRLLTRSDVIASSTPPSAAILQVRQAHPAHALTFAHAVQTHHFRDGADLNDLNTYLVIQEKLNLDLRFDLPPPDRPGAALQREYDETRALGISSFPTIMIATGARLETLSSKYDAEAFSTEVLNRFSVTH